MFNWTSLNRVGSSKFIRSSFTWIAVVPILAKTLQNIESPLNLQVFATTITIHLELPFSWVIFYFSALFFAVATGIYIFRCPKLIAKFSDLGEFLSSKHTIAQLPKFLHNDIYSDVEFFTKSHEVSPENEERIRRNNILLVRFSYLPHKNFLSLRDMVAGEASEDRLNQFNEDQLSGVFWDVRTKADISRPISRMICGICYSFGFVLVGIVLLQNLGYVVKAIIY